MPAQHFPSQQCWYSHPLHFIQFEWVLRGALSITDFEWMGEGDKIDLAEQWEKILLGSESAAMMNRGNGVT